ncbi:hypothetical protein PQX77_009435 [Marasmius sp. AFHP31]|nr:hypothetical protein PQX77_009435 [Marasmius sp. AFHP31]
MTRESDLARRSGEIRKFFRFTTSNKATVTQFLHDVDIEMKSYHAEINRHRTAIYTIERKRDKLKRTAELYGSLLSPIHNAPSEILTMIFTFACERNALLPSTTPDSLRLSMVCGRWRDIIFSTPNLWASIEVDFDQWTSNFHVLDELLELFIRQSKASPLRLALTLPGADYDGGASGRDEVLSILRSLVEQCERWEHVMLKTVPHHFPSPIFELIRDRLPLLRSLYLVKHHESGELDEWNHWKQLPFNYFDNCPALRTLHVSPELFEPPEEEIALPWTQIKTLRVSTCFNVTAFPFLALCTSAECFELSEAGGVPAGEADYSNHVVHNRVKIVDVVSAANQGEVDGVLRHVTLGNLSSLRISGSRNSLVDWPTWDSTCFETFLHRSSCTITSLYLKFLPITDVQTLSLLRMIPTIRSLGIEERMIIRLNRIVTGRFLDGLNASQESPSPSSTPLVPQLTDLKLVVHARHLDSDAFLTVLSSRWLPDPELGVGVECLRNVAIVVILSSGGDQDFERKGRLDCLECFRDAGMQISVTYGTLTQLYPDGA